MGNPIAKLDILNVSYIFILPNFNSHLSTNAFGFLMIIWYIVYISLIKFKCSIYVPWVSYFGKLHIIYLINLITVPQLGIDVYLYHCWHQDIIFKYGIVSVMEARSSYGFLYIYSAKFQFTSFKKCVGFLIILWYIVYISLIKYREVFLNAVSMFLGFLTLENFTLYI